MYVKTGQIATFLLFIFFLPISTVLLANELEQAPLILGQGEQRLLRIPGLLKYSLGSPAVRAISLSLSFQGSLARKESLLLKGISPGMSDLWVWKKDGSTEHRSIRVEKGAKDEHPHLERALGKLEEAEIIFTGKGVVLRGLISTRAESAKISALLRAFPQETHDETETAPQLLEQGQIQLERWLKSSNYGDRLRVEKINQTLWIRGYLERNSEKIQAEKQIKAIFPFTQIEIETLPDHSPTVYFRVFLLELKRSQFHSLGLSWPTNVAKAFQVTTGGIQDLFQMDLTLQQLEGNGHAKILSNPELVVRAPGEAELFAGGELPIRSLSRYNSNVLWKNYGLTLKLHVTHTAGDRVRLDIFTEVSHLDQNIAQDEIPGIQANRMKTQVDAHFGTPLLLSGLLQEGTRTEAKGLPFLRKIPVLGLLFGSEDYLNERSELVAILYPHAAPPRAPIERFSQLRPRIIPKGPVPVPRDWIPPSVEKNYRESENYPWNVLD